MPDKPIVCQLRLPLCDVFRAGYFKTMKYNLPRWNIIEETPLTSLSRRSLFATVFISLSFRFHPLNNRARCRNWSCYAPFLREIGFAIIYGSIPTSRNSQPFFPSPFVAPSSSSLSYIFLLHFLRPFVSLSLLRLPLFSLLASQRRESQRLNFFNNKFFKISSPGNEVKPRHAGSEVQISQPIKHLGGTCSAYAGQTDKAPLLEMEQRRTKRASLFDERQGVEELA